MKQTTRRIVLWVGVVAIGGAVFTVPAPRVRPWPIVQAGGTLVPWDSALRATWDDVMRCTGLDRKPDTRVSVWQLPRGAPRMSRGPNALGAFEGLYFVDLHAIVLAPFDDSAKADTVLRHELVHARLRTANGKHERVFFERAVPCGLGDTTLFLPIPQ